MKYNLEEIASEFEKAWESDHGPGVGDSLLAEWADAHGDYLLREIRRLRKERSKG